LFGFKRLKTLRLGVSLPLDASTFFASLSTVGYSLVSVFMCLNHSMTLGYNWFTQWINV